EPFRHLNPFNSATGHYVFRATISIRDHRNKPSIGCPRRQANIIVSQPDTVHTGLDRSRNTSLKDGLNALRVHYGELHWKRSRVGNKPVERGLFTGCEPTMIRRQHRKDKNFPLDATRTSAHTSTGSPSLGGSVHRGRSR